MSEPTDTEFDFVYQCQYCGKYVPVDHVEIHFVFSRLIDDTTALVLPGTYCSKHCGERGVAAHTISIG